MSDWNYSCWGYEVKISQIGWWGHKCNTEWYRFTGEFGTFPNYTYRFTRFGQDSVLKDKFNDIEIKSENFKEGYTNALFSIDEIKKSESKEL